MEIIIKFDLWGNFGHFKFPFTSPNHLKKTFNIIPRTTLLGLLGSILGLNGYPVKTDANFEPEFFNILKHIPICINLNEIFNTDIISYNSLNSFSNDAKKDAQDGGSNVIIKEEILLNPKYEILLLLNLDKEYDKRLFELFKSAQKDNVINSKYHVYLGKNEFFANIENIEIYTDNFSREKIGSLNFFEGIIPKKYVNEFNQAKNYVFDSFSSNIDFSNKKIRTNLVEVVYFTKEEKRGEIELNGRYDFIKIVDKYYYFWRKKNENKGDT
jgi:CRISPR-associated protein Cas5 subtype I-B